MQNNVTLTEKDEGKSVVNSRGDEVGRVVEIDHGAAHVEPDPGLTDTIKAKMGWAEGDEETYQVDEDSIDSVSENEVRLNN